MKRQRVVVLLLLLISICSTAKTVVNDKGDVLPNDEFIIYDVNTKAGTIQIGNEQKAKGDKFIVDNPILFKNNNDYIKVASSNTGSRYKISAKSYMEVGESTIFKFIKKKFCATKSANTIESVGEFLGQYVWDIIDDELKIPIPLSLNDDCGIILTTTQGNISVIANYDDETAEFIITTEMLKAKGIDVYNIAQYVFYVEYYDHGKYKRLTNSFRMRYIPKYRHLIDRKRRASDK